MNECIGESMICYVHDLYGYLYNSSLNVLWLAKHNTTHWETTRQHIYCDNDKFLFGQNIIHEII